MEALPCRLDDFGPLIDFTFPISHKGNCTIGLVLYIVDESGDLLGCILRLFSKFSNFFRHYGKAFTGFAGSSRFNRRI